MSYLVGFFKNGKMVISGRVWANDVNTAIKKADLELFLRRPDLIGVKFDDIRIIQ